MHLGAHSLKKASWIAHSPYPNTRQGEAGNDKFEASQAYVVSSRAAWAAWQTSSQKKEGTRKMAQWVQVLTLQAWGSELRSPASTWKGVTSLSSQHAGGRDRSLRASWLSRLAWLASSRFTNSSGEWLKMVVIQSSSTFGLHMFEYTCIYIFTHMTHMIS